MKLMELTGIKHLKDKTPKELVNYTSSLPPTSKLRMLGSGMNGVALTDGKNVFKFWHRDSGYEEFVDFCIKNPNNKFLPKIYGGIKSLPVDFQSGDLEGEIVKGIKYVKMEKLEPLDDYFTFLLLPENSDENIELGIDVISDVLMNYDYHDFESLIIAFYEYVRDEVEWESPRLIEIIKSVSNGVSDNHLMFMNKNLFNFLETLFTIIDSSIVNTPDLHQDNFAQRGGEVVILDPLSNPSDVDINLRIL